MVLRNVVFSSSVGKEGEVPAEGEKPAASGSVVDLELADAVAALTDPDTTFGGIPLSPRERFAQTREAGKAQQGGQGKRQVLPAAAAAPRSEPSSPASAVAAAAANAAGSLFKKNPDSKVTQNQIDKLLESGFTNLTASRSEVDKKHQLFKSLMNLFEVFSKEIFIIGTILKDKFPNCSAKNGFLIGVSIYDFKPKDGTQQIKGVSVEFTTGQLIIKNNSLSLPPVQKYSLNQPNPTALYSKIVAKDFPVPVVIYTTVIEYKSAEGKTVTKSILNHVTFLDELEEL